jgi:hypothetical protein
LWLWCSTAADVSISLACGWGLYSRINSFNDVTDSLLRKLVVIVCRTAAYTSILSFIDAVMLSIWPDDDLKSFITIAFFIPMVRVRPRYRHHPSKLTFHVFFLNFVRQFFHFPPQSGLYGLALFTFSAGARRAVDSRFGGSANNYLPHVRPLPKCEGRPPSIPPGGFVSPNHRNSANFAPTPLQISVQQESQTTYDIDDSLDEEIELRKYEQGRQRRRDRDMGMA